MRNLYCNVEALRKQVFAAVAKLAYEGGDYCSRMEKLPYEIIPGEVGTYRESIFLERAIVGERIRLAMGLPLRDVTEENMISDGVEASAISEKYYDPPLINIIKYACHACPDTHYEVTQACQGCLAKHCYQSCPKGAIELEHGRARIDQTKCIKCGRCKEACSYQAIIKFLRPCQEACGMNAIGKDQYGRADIDHEKCVNCGQCLVNCPFGAIVDKGQIFQLIHAIKKGEKVIAIIAPAFWGQFGEKVTPGQIPHRHEAAGLRRTGGGGGGRRPLRRGGGGGVHGARPRQTALYGNLLLPGMVRHGQEGVPRLCAVHLHDHDPHGADGPTPEAEAPRLQDRLYWPLRRQEAGGQPPQRPQRGGLRADL